jgi:hypothetical protein
MKRGIAIFRLVKHHVEHDQARTRAKQTIEQESPDFSRPREWTLCHHLKRAIIRDFVGRQWRQFQCALV